jgi:hypothetical protein
MMSGLGRVNCLLKCHGPAANTAKPSSVLYTQFVPISQLSEMAVNTLVDVIGVVEQVSERWFYLPRHAVAQQSALVWHGESGSLGLAFWCHNSP